MFFCEVYLSITLPCRLHNPNELTKYLKSWKRDAPAPNPTASLSERQQTDVDSTASHTKSRISLSLSFPRSHFCPYGFVTFKFQVQKFHTQKIVCAKKVKIHFFLHNKPIRPELINWLSYWTS